MSFPSMCSMACARFFLERNELTLLYPAMSMGTFVIPSEGGLFFS